jgi:hypothetical protein
LLDERLPNGDLAMLAKKIAMSVVLLAMAITGGFANEAGGTYIDCNSGYSSPVSPVRCAPDSW